MVNIFDIHLSYDRKKIELLKYINILIVVYSILLPSINYIRVGPADLIQDKVLAFYAFVGLVTYFLIKKQPRKYKRYLLITIGGSFVTFTSALIFAPEDGFRGIWFFLIIYVSYYVGNVRIGFLASLISFAIIIIYYYSQMNTLSTQTFISILVSLSILTHLSYYFVSILTESENKLKIQNGELLNYKHNLEDMVTQKLKEIDGLNDEMIKTQQEVIYTLGEISESRSKETGNHVKRVAEYSYLLATLSGIEESEANLLKMASPMHDIGKIGIDDVILKKPAKLSEEEFEIMKTHVEIGCNMLKHSERDIFKTAAIVASEHHEKYDGSGYPSGLKEDAIHIYGRITALADVFDALGSDRVYKKAWSDDAVLDYITSNSGKHFDPNLVSIFMSNLEMFKAIRDKYKDEFKKGV